MVKSLSISKKRLTKAVVVAAVAVSLFAATVYYSIPDTFRMRSIAFALGPNLPNSMNSGNSSVYSLVTELNVTFLNGTVWTSRYPDASTGELNSTDIKEIQLYPLPAYMGGLDLPEPYWAAIEFAADWGIHTELIDERTVDLGVLNVDNYTFSFCEAGDMSWPLNYTTPELNYTLQVDATGYWNVGPEIYGPWTWRIDTDQIQDILLNTTGPANISVNLDLGLIVYYQITTSDGTRAGNATVEWSGRWGTFQLLRDGSKLLGLRYSFSDVSLRMMAN